MPGKKHPHRYKKAVQKPSGRTIYKCILPLCTHYTTPELIVDRVAECQCGEQFVVTKALLEDRTNIVCSDCRFKRSKKVNSSRPKKILELDSVLDTRVDDLVNKLLG